MTLSLDGIEVEALLGILGMRLTLGGTPEEIRYCAGILCELKQRLTRLSEPQRSDCSDNGGPVLRGVETVSD